MAVKSVSELNEVTTLNDDDLFMVSTKDGSGNYSSSNKLTYGSLKSVIGVGGSGYSGNGCSPLFKVSEVSTINLLDVSTQGGITSDTSVIIAPNREISDIGDVYISTDTGVVTGDEYVFPMDSLSFQYTVNLKLKHDVFLCFPTNARETCKLTSPDNEITKDWRSSFDYALSAAGTESISDQQVVIGGWVARYCKFKGDTVSVGPFQSDYLNADDYTKLDLAIIETKGGSENVAEQKIYTDTVFYNDDKTAYDNYLSYECDVILADDHIMSTGMAYGSFRYGNKSYYLTNGCTKNLDKGYYVNKGSFASKYMRYIIPQSDPIPGIYYFKTYDLSSLIDADTSTSDIIRYNIPSEFQDYISATSFYSDIIVNLHSTFSGSLYFSGPAQLSGMDCINSVQFSDTSTRDGYLVYAEISPQSYGAYSAYKGFTLDPDWIQLYNGPLPQIYNFSKSYSRLTICEDVEYNGETTWYLYFPLKTENIKITFAYLKYTSVTSRSYE